MLTDRPSPCFDIETGWRSAADLWGKHMKFRKVASIAFLGMLLFAPVHAVGGQEKPAPGKKSRRPPGSAPTPGRQDGQAKRADRRPGGQL
jgi:hypothetical protein